VSTLQFAALGEILNVIGGEVQSILGRTAVFSNRCRLTVSDVRASLMMEVARTSETSVDIDLRKRQYVPENSGLRTRLRENLISHVIGGVRVIIPFKGRIYYSNFLCFNPVMYNLKHSKRGEVGNCKFKHNQS
jgi:hypothetical protein